MNIDQWGVAVGVAVSAGLAMTPWIFMVHAKLAVLGTQLASLEHKVDRLIESNEERLPMCARHATRLDTHDVQIAQLCERLRQME